MSLLATIVCLDADNVVRFNGHATVDAVVINITNISRDSVIEKPQKDWAMHDTVVVKSFYLINKGGTCTNDDDGADPQEPKSASATQNSKRFDRVRDRSILIEARINQSGFKVDAWKKIAVQSATRQPNKSMHPNMSKLMICII